ncbi:uncharacterized protein LOC122153739 [Tyto alba]|uniref:uncharacterized protein LOC122153739 n=1 Tax=Tyto alba TaxID=56313 RepID=UPI001C668C0F|nr:uncharacterized protein LOC122153739 [Tyto alba]
MLATLWVDHGIYIPYVSTRLQNDLCFLPRPFSKLQPASVNYEAETPFQPDFDNSALRKYTHFQKIMKKATSNQYNQTSYKAAFDVPCLNAGNPCWLFSLSGLAGEKFFIPGHESKYTPTDPGPHIIWASTGRMFSTFQAYT